MNRRGTPADRGWDIGTAKPSRAERAAVIHHLIDIRDPWQPFSAAEFARLARPLIREIHSRGNLPLLVGGTMFYFRALERGLPPLPSANTELRMRIEQQARQRGWPALHAELRERDPRRAAQIDPNDRQRIARALEILELTGRPVVAPTAPERREFHWIRIALTQPRRAQLHDRIAGRFASMLAAGLVEEVRNLLDFPQVSPELPVLRMVGYRQVAQYLQGELRYNELQPRGVAATRQLAKRQLTWLRQQRGLTWIYAGDEPGQRALQTYVESRLDLLDVQVRLVRKGQ